MTKVLISSLKAHEKVYWMIKQTPILRWNSLRVFVYRSTLLGFVLGAVGCLLVPLSRTSVF